MATIGCDIASVDDNGTPNWAAARSQGHLRFCGLRVAEGLTTDPWYARYRQQLADLGVPSFPYLLLVPGLATPEAQVDHALGVTGALDRRYYPIALDVEGSRRGLTPVQWRDWVVQAALRVKSSFGVMPLLYTSQVYWADPDGMAGLPAPELVECLGWWKYYPWPVRSPAVYDPAVVDRLAAPPVPAPWGTQWGLEQYQGDALGYPGFRSTVDLDRVNVVQRGSRGGLVAWTQRRLPGVVADGDFGPQTETAVRAFQAAQGLAADGVVGLDTAQRLCWVAPTAG